jgi:hypothetical protein
MKKIIFAFLSIVLLVSNLFAKQVTVCTSYIVGATAELECTGDFTGKSTMVDLYKKGWTYISNISGTNKFVLIFEK